MFKAARILKQQGKFAYKNEGQIKTKFCNEGLKFKAVFGEIPLKRCLHQSLIAYYPATKQLPLPVNIEDLASSEKLNFSPQRSRDINGEYISTSSQSFNNDFKSDMENQTDNRIECYDCSGAVNLSSAMETNVPFPFISKGKPTHLNMPVGQSEQKDKYMSEDLNNVHPVNNRQSSDRKGTTCSLGSKTGAKNFYFWFPNRNSMFLNSLLCDFSTANTFQFRNFCITKDKLDVVEEKIDKRVETPQLSRKEKLKAAVKDYGSVVVVFHVTISLISLGCCYLVVASGVDLSYILKEFGADEGGGAAGTAAHFVIAYAVHKAMAPGRIAITLTSVPFIVRKLRKMGVLKTPVSKPQ